MRFKDQLKKELMVFAIKNDFFGYGSICAKRSDGKYIAIVDAERFVYTASELASQWDTIDENDKREIISYYLEKELI